jgi:hypothetical protein
MNELVAITTVRVRRKLITEVMDHLRHMGRQGYEGFALWAGELKGSVFEITHTLIPAQKGIRSQQGVCVVIGPEELHRLNVWLYQNSRILVAQIHSHPTEAYHSDTDDDYPIATTVGGLSLVVPDFAKRPFSLDTTAVYRLSAGGRWEQLSLTVARRLIEVTDEGF